MKLEQHKIEALLNRTNEIAMRTVEFGKHPFGCLLLAPDGESILIEQGNIDVVDHAEAVLARAAHRSFTPEFLWQCTLVTSVEPCCMCAGTIYWANIGTVIYGITEAQLLEITGNSAENPTLSVSCRYVFEHGQKPIEIIGPFDSIQNEIIAVHQNFWKLL